MSTSIPTRVPRRTEVRASPVVARVESTRGFATSTPTPASISSYPGSPLTKIKMKSSRFRGVSLNKKNNKWKAVITYSSKQRFLGYFEGEEEAALAYDRESYR